MSRNNVHNLKVGDTLYRRAYSKGATDPVLPTTVESLGIKYAELSCGHRIGLMTLMYRSKQYSQNDVQFYLTSQEIIDNERRELLQGKLLRKINSFPRKLLALDQLEQISKILNLEENE